MGKLLNSLKNLGAKLTGKEIESNKLVDVINETAENYEDSGTNVIANPTLAGTEEDLTGLQVGETKYKVPQGGSSGNAMHIIHIYARDYDYPYGLVAFVDDNTLETYEDLVNYLKAKGSTSYLYRYPVGGGGDDTFQAYVSMYIDGDESNVIKVATVNGNNVDLTNMNFSITYLGQD